MYTETLTKPDLDSVQYTVNTVIDTDSATSVATAVEAEVALTLEGYEAFFDTRKRCDFCGSTMRYAVLVQCDASAFYCYADEKCGSKISTNVTRQVSFLKEASAKRTERARVRKKRAALIAEHPDLVWLTYRRHCSWFSPFLVDVSRKFMSAGVLSEKQIQAALSAISRDASRYWSKVETAERRKEEESNAVDVPVGDRISIVARVVYISEKINDYSVNMVKSLLLQADYAGWKIWVTCPNRLYDEVKLNDLMSVVVNIRPSKNPKVGYGKRPTKARIISFDAE